MTEAPIEGPVHGQAGWTLADYKWSDKSGVATCVYRQKDNPAVKIVRRFQPTGPWHTGRIADETDEDEIQ